MLCCFQPRQAFANDVQQHNGGSIKIDVNANGALAEQEQKYRDSEQLEVRRKSSLEGSGKPPRPKQKGTRGLGNKVVPNTSSGSDRPPAFQHDSDTLLSNEAHISAAAQQHRAAAAAAGSRNSSNNNGLVSPADSYQPIKARIAGNRGLRSAGSTQSKGNSSSVGCGPGVMTGEELQALGFVLHTPKTTESSKIRSQPLAVMALEVSDGRSCAQCERLASLYTHTHTHTHTHRHTYTHTYTHTHTHTQTQTHTHIRTHKNTHTHTTHTTHTHKHTHSLTHTQAHTHTHTHKRTHTHKHKHTHRHTHTHTYIHTYTHIRTHMQTCTHTCTHTHMHTQTQTYVHSHSRSRTHAHAHAQHSTCTNAHTHKH